MPSDSNTARAHIPVQVTIYRNLYDNAISTNPKYMMYRNLQYTRIRAQ